MAVKVEYFDNPLPYRLALENLFYWNAFNVRRFDTMYLADDILQILKVTHDTASTRSPTLQKSFSTPAAIAGVQRNVL